MDTIQHQTPAPTERHSVVERAVEAVLFSSRWLLAPFYIGLALALILLLITFAKRSIELFSSAFSATGDGITVGILGLVDISLMGNLLVMVIFAGYENFVSRMDLDTHRDKPHWMGHVGFGDLKLKLMTSIVAISAIHVLEAFMNLDHYSDRDLAWAVGIHMSFIISGLLLALMDRISGHK